MHWEGSRPGRSCRVLRPHINTSLCWWRLFVAFQLLHVWSEEIVLRLYLTLSAVISPVAVGLLCLHLITETCLKHWAVQIPHTERSESMVSATRPAGSLNEIADASDKRHFSVNTRDALMWNFWPITTTDNCLLYQYNDTWKCERDNKGKQFIFLPSIQFFWTNISKHKKLHFYSALLFSALQCWRAAMQLIWSSLSASDMIILSVFSHTITALRCLRIVNNYIVASLDVIILATDSV